MPEPVRTPLKTFYVFIAIWLFFMILLQSGYRPRHSCETLMIKMMNDILNLIEEKNTVALILLDISAAFDTIDHDILLKRLESDFGIKGVVLEWFRAYLKERSFTVLIGHWR